MIKIKTNKHKNKYAILTCSFVNFLLKCHESFINSFPCKNMYKTKIIIDDNNTFLIIFTKYMKQCQSGNLTYQY